ncbi:MAG: phage tail tape measure protein [Desulfobacteraceae bacterium]|nr:phage tail tape measure protein [Desulfobacteraceae bacterium]
MSKRAKIYELAFQIGGKLNRNFSGTMFNAQKRLNSLNKQIIKLEEGGKKVKTFRKLKTDIKGTEQELRNVQNEVAGLARQLRATDKPSKKLQNNFDKTRKKAKKLKNKLLEQRTAAARLNREMGRTGISTRNLAADNIALERSLNKTRLAQQKLNHALIKQKGLRRKQDAHKSRMMEAAGTGVVLAAPIVLPVKQAIDFESAMADVRKTVNFKTPEGFAEFSKMIAAMPRETKIPLQQEELAAIAASGGQLGIISDNLPSFIQTTSKMTIAFDMMADRAGDSAAKLSNIYEIPISKIDVLGDAINHLSDNTAAKAPEMIEVLQRIGGTAKNIGFTAVQSAALGNAMIALGKTPEIAGTSLTFLMSQLATVDKQGGKFNDALGLMGLSADELKDKLQTDAQGTMLKFLESIEKVDQSDRQGIIVDLFGKDHAKHIATLVGGLDKYRDALKLTANESKYLGSMQREFDNRSKTRANHLKLLAGISKEAAINFGTALFPALDLVVGGLGDLASGIAVFTEQNPALTQTIGLIGVGAVGLLGTVAALSGVGFVSAFALGGLQKIVIGYRALQTACLLTRVQLMALAIQQKAGAAAAGIMTAAQWALNVALNANPIGLVVAGIAALAGAAYIVYKKWQPISQFFKDLWEKLLGMFATMQKIISKIPGFAKKKWFGKSDKNEKEPDKESAGNISQKTNQVFIKNNGYKQQQKLSELYAKPQDPITVNNFSSFYSKTQNPISANEGSNLNRDLVPDITADALNKINNKVDNTINLTVSPTINIAPGFDTGQVKQAVSMSMEESISRMRKALDEIMQNDKRLAYG